MSDLEDQLGAYTAAIVASQPPVGLDEVVGRRRRRGSRRIAVVAAVVVVFAAAAGAGVVRDGSGSRRTQLGGTNAFGDRPTAMCPAASLVVTSTNGERLHPNWLPSGFVLTQGNETDLGQTGGLEYSTPGFGNRSYVEIDRRQSSQPLTRLYQGTPTPTIVDGHPGILSVGVPIPLWSALLWRPEPGVVLIVNGYDLSRPDLDKIATNLRYEPGSPSQYPTQVRVTVTRQQALASLPGPSRDKHVALTSFGELETLTHLRPVETGASLTRPVWVAWTTAPSSDALAHAARVIDARTDAVLRTMPVTPAIDSITDRSRTSCAPPFGVLTRSEATYLQPPLQGTGQIIKLSTLGTLATYYPEGNCAGPSKCDPTVPVWIRIQTAPDQRLMEMGLGAPPTNTKRGSFSITMMDARTGPQNTNLSGVTLGPGPPPPAILAVPDLTAPTGPPSKTAHVTEAAPLPRDIASDVCSAAATGDATSIEYVATTERRETQFLNTEDGNANTPVWVIEMRGSFTASRQAPGGTAPHGTVATATYDRKTHASIGDGIVNQYHDLHALGQVSTLTC